jgi:chaperonin GroEL
MPCKQILFRSAVREKLLNGNRVLADAVCVTLGPKSKSVLTQRADGIEGRSGHQIERPGCK